MSKAKAQLNGNLILLPLNYSQGGTRIADKTGNHFPSPTKIIKDKKYYIEWMITNDEIKRLSVLLLEKSIATLIVEMQNISKFAEDSKYAKRTTTANEEEVSNFEGFKIYQYMDIFNSFEKKLNSGLKVRLTFKLGDFGVAPHLQMYVLVPFSFSSLEIKNQSGKVEDGTCLGKGCIGELILNEEELKEIILTLAHASSDHRDDLVNKLKN